MKKIILFISLSLLFSVVACSARQIDVKSPCVGSEGSPCGVRKNINEPWLKEHYNLQKTQS